MEELTLTKRNVSFNSVLKSLWKTFPETELQEGKVIKYEQLEEIIGTPYKSNRFRSVISKWKNEVLHIAGKVLLNRVNVGYEVGDTHQRLSHAQSLQESGVKKIMKSVLVQLTNIYFCCLQCSNWNQKNLEQCEFTDYQLYPYRLGSNPTNSEIRLPAEGIGQISCKMREQRENKHD